MEDDFFEFIEYVEDNPYLPIPRMLIRDIQNPLERYSDIELIQRFRFSRHSLQNIILSLLYGNEEIQNNRGLPIPPVLKMCVALRFYATGSFQRVCGDIQSISQATVCRIVKEVSNSLASNLVNYVKFPTIDVISRNRTKFFEIAGFPGITGCIDGTHIPIINPGGQNAEVYRNRKSWMSLNIQAISGPNYEIFDIVIRWPGSAHDSRIFNNSRVKFRFEQQLIPGLLLGDSGYPQLPFLFTPVIDPQTRAEQRYNLRHASTRNIVERCFGIWKQRFRCISKKLSYKLQNTTKIIAATAVLHNIAVQEKEQLIQDPHFRDRIVPVVNICANDRANIIKAAFIERHFT